MSRHRTVLDAHYRDPGSDNGRLRSELFRAVRLVVDTGIHDMSWEPWKCGIE